MIKSSVSHYSLLERSGALPFAKIFEWLGPRHGPCQSDGKHSLCLLDSLKCCCKSSLPGLPGTDFGAQAVFPEASTAPCQGTGLEPQEPDKKAVLCFAVLFVLALPLNIVKLFLFEQFWIPCPWWICDGSRSFETSVRFRKLILLNWVWNRQRAAGDDFAVSQVVIS